MAASGSPARRSARAWSSPGRREHITAQVVDDSRRQDAGLGQHAWRPTCAPLDGDKSAKAKRVGELVAERAKAAGVEGVVFDRAGNKYHGRVAALADGAREGGLAF